MDQRFDAIQIHKHNFFQKIYPTVKIVSCFLMIIDAMILLSWKSGQFNLTYGLIYSLIPLIALLLFSGVWQRSWIIIKPILVIAILIFLFQTLLIPGGKVLFHAGPLMIRLQGLRSGVSLSTFILNISLIFIWLFQTTEVKEFNFAFLKREGNCLE